MRYLSAFVLLLGIGCGNYSLLEMIGPDSDYAYFRLEPGRYWAYSGTWQQLHQDPVPVVITNHIALSPFFADGSYLVITNQGTVDDGLYGYHRERNGYSQVFNILSQINPTWNPVAVPARISMPFLTTPFVEGRYSTVTRTQIVTNYPLLLSSIPAVVRILYTTENRVHKNNLTMEINGTEYEKCVKISHTLRVTVSSLGRNDPYEDGDVIQTTEDAYTFHLAPGIGMISIIHVKRTLGQDNIYTETRFAGDLLSTGTLY